MSLPEITVVSLTGDLKRGGWIANCTIENDIDAIEQGDIISLSGKSTYNSTTAQPYFQGVVVADPDNITFTRLKSKSSFQVATVDTLLGGESLQSIGFTEQASPANDHQILPPMRTGAMVDHILRKHANPVFDAATNTDGIVTVVNIAFGESINLLRYNVQKSNNFWRALQGIGGGETAGVFYRPFFNRRNEFVYRAAPFFLSPPATSKGTVRIKFNNNQPSDRIGQANIVSTKDFKTVYQSQFPLAIGNGKILRLESGIFASSQSDSDRNAERIYKWLTRSYTLTLDVDPALVLFGEDGTGLDLADKITIVYDGPVEDAITGSGMTLNINDDFYIYGASIKMDTNNLSAVGTLTLEIDNP